MSEADRWERTKEAWNDLSDRCPIDNPARLAARGSAIAAGWLCMVIGVVLIFTLCGAVIGWPLFVFGALLVARGLF